MILNKENLNFPKAIHYNNHYCFDIGCIPPPAAKAATLFASATACGAL